MLQVRTANSRFPGLPATQVNYQDFNSPAGLGHCLEKMFEEIPNLIENFPAGDREILDQRLKRFHYERTFHIFLREFENAAILDPAGSFFKTLIKPYLFHSSPFHELLHYLYVSDETALASLKAIDEISAPLKTVSWSVYKICSLLEELISPKTTKKEFLEIIEDLGSKPYMSLVSDEIWDYVKELYSVNFVKKTEADEKKDLIGTAYSWDYKKFISYFINDSVRDLMIADLNDFEMDQEMLDFLWMLPEERWTLAFAIPGFKARLSLANIKAFDSLEEWIFQLKFKEPRKFLAITKEFPELEAFDKLLNKNRYVEYVFGNDQLIDFSDPFENTGQDHDPVLSEQRALELKLTDQVIRAGAAVSPGEMIQNFSNPQISRLLFLSKQPLTELNLLLHHKSFTSSAFRFLNDLRQGGFLIRLDNIQWTVFKLLQLIKTAEFSENNLKDLRFLPPFNRIDRRIWSLTQQALTTQKNDDFLTAVLEGFRDPKNNRFYLYDADDFIDTEACTSFLSKLELKDWEGVLKLPRMSQWTGLKYDALFFVVEQRDKVKKFFESLPQTVFLKLKYFKTLEYINTTRAYSKIPKDLIAELDHGYLDFKHCLVELDKLPEYCWALYLHDHQDQITRFFHLNSFDLPLINELLGLFKDPKNAERFLTQTHIFPRVFNAFVEKTVRTDLWPLFVSNSLFQKVFKQKLSQNNAQLVFESLAESCQGQSKEHLLLVKGLIEEGAKMRDSGPKHSYQFKNVASEHEEAFLGLINKQLALFEAKDKSVLKV